MQHCVGFYSLKMNCSWYVESEAPEKLWLQLIARIYCKGILGYLS